MTSSSRRAVAFVAAAGALVTAMVALLFVTRSPAVTSERPFSAAPAVGRHLHSVGLVENRLFVGGHDAVSVTADSGRTWRPVPSLAGADAMAWAVSADVVLTGGHLGLHRSTDGGVSFAPATGPAAVPDVHALGGAGATVYAASARLGLLASTDGGSTWQLRNRDTGRSFSGNILVDAAAVDRLIVADTTGGLAASADGGRSWTRLGGPTDAVSAIWNPADTRQVMAVGADGRAQVSIDRGATWKPVELPARTAAVTYDTSGRHLYAAVPEDSGVRVYRSADSAPWQPLT
jgi:photosystem II stability/assembly factor-like uncharacterized protein